MGGASRGRGGACGAPSQVEQIPLRAAAQAPAREPDVGETPDVYTLLGSVGESPEAVENLRDLGVVTLALSEGCPPAPTLPARSGSSSPLCWD